MDDKDRKLVEKLEHIQAVLIIEIKRLRKREGLSEEQLSCSGRSYREDSIYRMEKDIKSLMQENGDLCKEIVSKRDRVWRLEKALKSHGIELEHLD